MSQHAAETSLDTPPRLTCLAFLSVSSLPAQPVSELGFDILADRPSIDDLAAGLRSRSAIKSVLLDQSFSAGVGNWVSDQILHTAKIHPSERACDLNREQLADLQKALIEVPTVAVAVNADDSRYPKGAVQAFYRMHSSISNLY